VGQAVHGRRLFGAAPKTFSGEVLRARRTNGSNSGGIVFTRFNWELFDKGIEASRGTPIQETVKSAGKPALVVNAQEQRIGALVSNRFEPNLASTTSSNRDAIQGTTIGPGGAIQGRVFFWPRQGRPKGDLVDDEDDGGVIQVPGWGNIFTQPIINRIEMLSTDSHRHRIKVSGPISFIEKFAGHRSGRKAIHGARDVWPRRSWARIPGDRYRPRKAARYGISVEDIQKRNRSRPRRRIITYTVEKSATAIRFRSLCSHNREDEESVKRLLVSPGSMATPRHDSPRRPPTAACRPAVTAAPGHAEHGARGKKSPIPLSALAGPDRRRPAMIKSENASS